MSAISGRSAAVHAAQAWFDRGELASVLARRVAFSHRKPARRFQARPSSPTSTKKSRRRSRASASRRASSTIPWRRPVPHRRAHRGCSRCPTVLTYGHGDVILGYDAQWREGLSPGRSRHEGDRWYGRGTADNKGQHTINFAALERVIEARGRLGFNVKVLLETGEETGSPGLRDVCIAEREALAADVLIASDGPRLRAAQPTLFLGSRGAFNFDLAVDLRSGGHHSGNWGGLLANPGTILAHAIASLVDARGRILVEALRPPAIPPAVRAALAGIDPGEPEGPAIDETWGEPGLTPAERVFAWNTLEVLAFVTGNPAHPVNAIPPRASAHMQLRFVVGCDAGRRSCPRCARTSTRAAFATSTWPLRAPPSCTQRGSIPRIRGSRASRDRSRRRPDARLRSCPTSAARCRTTASPTYWACRRSGCRIRIRRARSTRRRAHARLGRARRAFDHDRRVLGHREWMASQGRHACANRRA